MRIINKLGIRLLFHRLRVDGIVARVASCMMLTPPDWISEKVDSIANSKKDPEEEVLEGMQEDVYLR